MRQYDRDQVARELHEVFKAQPTGKQTSYEDLPEPTRNCGLAIADWVIAKITADRFESLASLEQLISELHRVNKELIEARREAERALDDARQESYFEMRDREERQNV
jgi:hypothetical protein